MSPRGAGARYAVLTPGLTGADGISELSRLVVRALRPAAGEPATLDVFSMTDPPSLRAGEGPVSNVRFFGAGGRRAWFVATALRAVARGWSRSWRASRRGGRCDGRNEWR